MRNSFNLLLVTLAAFDAVYLACAVLESFRKVFGLASDVHVVLFPHLLYPLYQITMTGSIFMTVAVAGERFTAVQYPHDYNRVSSLCTAQFI
jgi:hypothetical protein